MIPQRRASRKRMRFAKTLPGAVLLYGGALKFGASGIYGDNSYRMPTKNNCQTSAKLLL